MGRLFWDPLKKLSHSKKAGPWKYPTTNIADDFQAYYLI